MREFRFKLEPFKHQRDCFELNKQKRYFAYLAEMGTGKSKMLLDAAQYLWCHEKIEAVLIFANKGSYANWIKKEIPKHWPSEDIRTEAFLWKAGMNKKEQRSFEKVLTEIPKDSIRFLVMNIECLAYERSAKVALSFAKKFECLAAVDESTMIKNHKAKRTKTAIKIGGLALARRILTGSVVDNSPLNAFAQFQFLKPGCLGFTSYYVFRAMYAELVDMTLKTRPRTFKIVKGYKNVEDLKRRMADFSFIVKKDDCLDLPPKTYQTFHVELTEDQKQKYAELKRFAMTTVNDQLVSVKVALTKLLRFHQIVCGFITDDEKKEHPLPSNRLDALVEVLEETSGQVIIWANYRFNIFQIASHLKQKFGKEKVMTYFGDTKDDERDRANRVFDRDFKDDEGVLFLVANPQTGGYGLNLTRATTHVYYSNNFDGEKRNQSEDRSHRYGQTKKVTYVDLIAKDVNIDEKILKVLREKKKLAQVITESNWQEFI